jgi:hypothetical protein
MLLLGVYRYGIDHWDRCVLAQSSGSPDCQDLAAQQCTTV